MARASMCQVLLPDESNRNIKNLNLRAAWERADEERRALLVQNWFDGERERLGMISDYLVKSTASLSGSAKPCEAADKVIRQPEVMAVLNTARKMSPREVDAMNHVFRRLRTERNDELVYDIEEEWPASIAETASSLPQ